ncbi:hypothetical protein LINPERPRIM_LOCUS7990 [Linum perenne]
MVGRSIPLTSYGAETGKSLFLTFFEKATTSLICLPTTDTVPLILVMLTVFTHTRLIELFGLLHLLLVIFHEVELFLTNFQMKKIS